ncbi:hypothetical protein RRG08_025119 [Elysia crispata]|uniref:Uncharacterized protein n=1 Tax=Elysia crispata TaxID=231223 RepID=A0AAE1AIE8_9GAST|nr:hypothetical protein RRG08_025119 [Elysia crispata]
MNGFRKRGVCSALGTPHTGTAARRVSIRSQLAFLSEAARRNDGKHLVNFPPHPTLYHIEFQTSRHTKQKYTVWSKVLKELLRQANEL